jgi:hypothetical protein
VRSALVTLFLIAVARAAIAQPAFAIGKPLAMGDVPAGTVTVKVIAGSVANVVPNVDVTLDVNGTPRKARTDSTGRATFKDLPSGATVQAKIEGEDKKEIASESFPLGDTGVRVMLTTKPITGGPPAFGGGGAGGEPPMDPLAVSGQPRPDPSQKPGTYNVRVVYDSWKDNAAGMQVTLVGYDADDQITVASKTTDDQGRALFDELDRTGATSYFVMALVRRGDVVDRLMSQAVVLDAVAGMKLVLSAGKRDGNVVAIEGVPEGVAEVEIVDAATGTLVAKQRPAIAAPDITNITGGAHFEPKSDFPAGSLDVVVHGGATGDDAPLPGIAVKVIPATGDLASGIDSTTDPAGLAHFETKIQGELRVLVTINGRPMTSNPFTVAQMGGVLDVEAAWEARGKPEAMFDIAPSGKVVYAQTTARGATYRSLPLLAMPGRGTRISLFVLPRALFGFSLTSHVDDTYLAVSGRFEIRNNSWAPFKGGPDGIVIPLPRGFKGAIVAPKDAQDVAVDDGGYRILRPIPPGEKQFHGAFSLPIDAGTVAWSLDLPYGAFQSGMEILQPSAAMRVDTPAGVSGKTMTVPQGTFFVLPQISIHPKQSMVMTIRGLPSPPWWVRWTPRLVGLGVVALILAGLAFALYKRAPASAADAAREVKRQKLLDELVELEAEPGKKAGKRRDVVLAELEKLWD